MAELAEKDGYAGKAGFLVFPGYFDAGAQRELLAALRAVLQEAPLFTPRMPKSGRPFTVRMSNCGALGWMSDQDGYRYAPAHPQTGRHGRRCRKPCCDCGTALPTIRIRRRPA